MRDAMRLRVHQQVVNRRHSIPVGRVNGQAAPDQNFIFVDPQPHAMEDPRRRGSLHGTIWTDPDAGVGRRMTADWPRRRIRGPILHLTELRQSLQIGLFGMQANPVPVGMLDPPDGHDEVVPQQAPALDN